MVSLSGIQMFTDAKSMPVREMTSNSAPPASRLHYAEHNCSKRVPDLGLILVFLGNANIYILITSDINE